MRNGYVLFTAIVWFACGSALDAQTTNRPPVVASDVLLKKAGVHPIGDWQVDPAETAYLESVFGQAAAAADAIVPGPDASAERHAIDNLLRGELEGFVATNATSAYAPGLHVLLGHRARMRCGYSLAMEHYKGVGS